MYLYIYVTYFFPYLFHPRPILFNFFYFIWHSSYSLLFAQINSPVFDNYNKYGTGEDGICEDNNDMSYEDNYNNGSSSNSSKKKSGKKGKNKGGKKSSSAMDVEKNDGGAYVSKEAAIDAIFTDKDVEIEEASAPASVDIPNIPQSWVSIDDIRRSFEKNEFNQQRYPD